MSESDPSWDEALAGFCAAEPVRLVRSPRVLVLEAVPAGDHWYVTCPELACTVGLYPGSRQHAEQMARGDLAEWLDPAVTVEFRR